MTRNIFKYYGSAVLLNGNREVSFCLSSGQGLLFISSLILSDLCLAKTEDSLILGRLK